MANVSNIELKTVVNEHVTKITGQTPSDQEVAECADGLVSFFKLLIEADKDLVKVNMT